MKPNIIERAYQLAPHCSRTRQLREMLQREGYMQVDDHLSGLGLQRELRRLYNKGAGTKKRGGPRKVG